MKNLHSAPFSPFRLLQRLMMVPLLVLSLSSAGAQQNELDEAAMLDAVNAERASNGLNPLTWNNQLEEAALGHTADMSNNDFMSHTGSNGSTMTDRINAAGYQWSRISENVARGYTSVSSVMDGWMNSPGHRANILDSEVTEMGAARVGNFWTQNFGRPASGQPSNDKPDSQGGGGGGTGGGGTGGGSSSPSDPAGSADYYRGLASYYYHYMNFFEEGYWANAYYYFYMGFADYVTHMSLDQVAEANWNYYLGLALYSYYSYLAIGDTTASKAYYYFYLAYAYFSYFLGHENYEAANAYFDHFYSFAFE